MTQEFVYQFASQHPLAVLATSPSTTQPEAAVIGIAITESLEIVFDTVKSSRKYKNLLQNRLVAVVIGWDNETTLQLEGEAVELNGPGADRYKEVYFSVYPDGRQRAETWPGLVHFVVKPRWLRYSNFNVPVVIEEMSFD